MKITSENVAKTVFKPVARGDLGNFSLDGQSLSLLMALDGKKTVADVAAKIGLGSEKVVGVISRLMQLGLIEAVRQEVAKADADFFKRLAGELSLAIGPLASVLIEDGVDELGFRMNAFPSDRVAELVQLLAEQIERAEKRQSFAQNMLKIIQQKQY